MVADPRQFPELHEACTDDACARPLWPNGWARLTADLQLMSEEDQGKLVEGLKLLSEAGIGFDTGYGGGGFDMELDWSLEGARIEVGPLRCMADGCSNGEGAMRTRHGFNPAYWSLYGFESRTWARVYCSETCRSTADAERLAARMIPSDYEGTALTQGEVDALPGEALFPHLILHDVAEALEAL